MTADQPAAFEIVQQPNTGARVASNGRVRLMLSETDGELFRRRGIAGIALKPAAEVVLPQLNELAGDLVGNLGMPANEVVSRIDAIKATVQTGEPRRIEWAVARLDGVSVYFDGETVIVTRADLPICG